MLELQEVRRIRSQHLNDREAIDKGRVKGKLNVTRAFGAGFLKDVSTHQSKCPCLIFSMHLYFNHNICIVTVMFLLGS